MILDILLVDFGKSQKALAIQNIVECSWKGSELIRVTMSGLGEALLTSWHQSEWLTEARGETVDWSEN